MSLRERWTVYPLLFLTLGLVMRDRVEQQDTAAGQVFVQELVVVDDQGQGRFRLTAEGWEPRAPKGLGELTLPELLKRLSPNRTEDAPQEQDE